MVQPLLTLILGWDAIPTASKKWLRRIGEYARLAAIPFLEIWIVNEYGDPAQQVPLCPR
jgi:hypothetical protein